MNTPKHQVLVLLAHPSLHHSQINKTLRNAIKDVDGITLHDLYDTYPEFYIDVKHEQQLLLQHELIVFQHPLYWYSTTPMLKLWQDVVLSKGFAYGKNGTALHGKDFFQMISTGGKEEAYQKDGYNQFTIDQLMSPLKATTRMCGMNFHSPMVIHRGYKVTEAEMIRHASRYRELLSLYTLEGSKCFDERDI